jgi:hypothetical protein
MSIASRAVGRRLSTELVTDLLFHQSIASFDFDYFIGDRRIHPSETRGGGSGSGGAFLFGIESDRRNTLSHASIANEMDSCRVITRPTTTWIGGSHRGWMDEWKGEKKNKRL